MEIFSVLFFFYIFVRQPICTVSLITFLWHVFLLRVRHSQQMHVHSSNTMYVSMPFGFWEVKITRRCVLMNVRSKFQLAPQYTPFCRCNFLCLPLNYSNAMSIEFQIEQNGISICTCHFIYEKRELHTTQNDEEIFPLISIICLDLFLFFDFFSRLIGYSITFTCTLFQFFFCFNVVYISFELFLFFHITIWSWLITPKDERTHKK